VERHQWETELVACYARVVRALIVLARNREQGEDAFHDALTAALQPGVMEGIRRADAWLFTVGLRSLRKSRWKARLDVPLRIVRRTTAPPTTERVEVIELLGQLAPRQREIVIARFYLDLSYQQIAEAFDISVGTATATVSQALARLRKSEQGRATWTNANN
jgi:RNA polymerase sigma factor (sigma-70 family)